MTETAGYEIKQAEESVGKAISARPKEENQEQLEVILPDPKSSKVSYKDAEDACRVLGLKPIRIKKLSKSATIGKFITQLGAVTVGQGKLLVADQQIEKGLKLCDKFLNEYSGDAETIASLMKIRLGLIDAMLKTAHTLIKVNKDSGAVDLEMKPLNQAFPANTPVQNNVQVNVVATREEK